MMTGMSKGLGKCEVLVTLPAHLQFTVQVYGLVPEMFLHGLRDAP
jgi:hypothetical protein